MQRAPTWRATTPRTIVYDMLRLFLAASDDAPRGIDRVDLAYARFLLQRWGGDCLALLPTPWGLRVFDRGRALRLVDSLETRWREAAPAETDPMLAAVLQRLADPDGAPTLADEPARPPAPSLLRATSRVLGALAAFGIGPGRSAAASVPAGAIYLNVGQLGWAAAWMARWLRHRPDVRPIYMLHDVIPIEHPDMVSAIGTATHRRMVDTTARHAAGLILTTEPARDAVLREMAARGRTDSSLQCVSLLLPVADVFARAEAPDEALRRHRYFFMCGAIEPRKNHLMLLQAWQELTRRLGPRTPWLVVAGSPARGGPEILRALADCPRIIVVAGLSSPALRRLMGNATAVLMPSRAEGFGLPIIEALSVGTPVLASDLPAHRAVADGFCQFLDPLDVDCWTRAVEAFAGDAAVGAAWRARIAGYRPLTTERYFQRVAAFLEKFA